MVHHSVVGTWLIVGRKSVTEVGKPNDLVALHLEVIREGFSSLVSEAKLVQIRVHKICTQDA